MTLITRQNPYPALFRDTFTQVLTDSPPLEYFFQDEDLATMEQAIKYTNPQIRAFSEPMTPAQSVAWRSRNETQYQNTRLQDSIDRGIDQLRKGFETAQGN